VNAWRFLAEPLEVLVRDVLGREVGGDRAQVLDGLAGDALTDREPHLPDRAVREADVAAHDELVPLAFEEIERADRRVEDERDAARRVVEECHERHRLRAERDEVEDVIEALVARSVYMRGAW